MLAILALLATQITFFVVPPIGAVPEGRTLVVLRMRDGQFIDSADAMCVRIQESVNLLCRGMVLGAVAENSTILARLPYSRALYLISTDRLEYTQSRE